MISHIINVSRSLRLTCSKHDIIQNKFILFLTVVICTLVSGNMILLANDSKPVPVVVDVSTPEKLTLCDIPLPLERNDVREMLDRELTISVWDRAQCFMWLKRQGRYFPYIEDKLKEAGLPDDLKYLAVAESALIYSVSSDRGAVGIWQFMAPTARRFGLNQNRYVDERRNFMLSTEAAIKYLIYLKKKFGSWFITMGAYNCGEGNMKKYMEYQKKDNFFDLKLPNETERYLYRIAVAKLIMENPGSYGYVIPQKNIYTPVRQDLVLFKLDDDVYTNDFAKVFNLSYLDFKKLNPQFLGSVMFKGSYRINIPENQPGHVNLWMKEINEIKPVKKAKQIDFYYIVKKGDTLGKIAYRNGTSINKLKKINNLKSSTIYVGQKIRVKS